MNEGSRGGLNEQSCPMGGHWFNGYIARGAPPAAKEMRMQVRSGGGDADAGDIPMEEDEARGCAEVDIMFKYDRNFEL